MHDPKITAVLRYRDPVRSAHWLRDAFGLRIDSINENPPGTIDYICLGYGASVLLVGPTVAEENRGRPNGDDRQESLSCYLTVTGIKAHYARAVAHGADVSLNAEDPEAGSDFYVCRDPEGHMWSFGTHDFTSTGRAPVAPGAGPDPSTANAEPAATPPIARRGTSIGLLVYTALVASGITAGAFLLPISQDDTVVTLLVGGHTQGSATVEPTGSATLDLLRSEISGLQRERGDLMSEVKQAENARGAAAVARDQSQKRLAEAIGDLEIVRRAEAAARTSGEAGEAKLAALSKELDGASASLAWERSAKKKIEAELQSAIADRNDARTQVRRLSETVENLRNANTQGLERAAASAGDQALVLQDLETKLDALSKDLAQRTWDLAAERAARAKSEAFAEAAGAERKRIEAALAQSNAAVDADRAGVARLEAELGELRQSHQAALETIKLKEEERASAHAKLDARIADTTKQLVAARAATEALQPIVLALRARVEEFEAADQGSSDTATMAKLEKRYKQDLSAKDKLIASLSQQIDDARKLVKPATTKTPAKPRRLKAKAPAKAKGKVAAAGSGAAAAAQTDADDFVFEDDAEAMQPERVRRCSRAYFDHC